METNFNKNYDTTVPRDLQVTFYGELEPYNDALSKGRVRIFYRGLNRNRTFITDDFANQLIKSLPYTPIKGIYDQDSEDFTDHGKKNSDGRIYGVVMAEPNFAWESHLDTDGVTREYACADVLLYTSLYSEAKLIPGSSQSMEINPFTFDGAWEIYDDGKPFFKFTKGSLFGLQVLGMATEPCFEGAAFYYDLIKEDIQPFISYIKSITKEEKKMDELKFRLSDDEKAHKIFKALNSDAQAYEDIKYWIMSVYDDYALVQTNDHDGKTYRAYYTKNEDEVTLGDMVECYIVDVTETEMKALEAMKMAAGSYEAAAENYTSITEANATLTSENETLKSELAAEKENATTAAAEYEAKVADYDVKIADYEKSAEESKAALEEAAAKYSTLESEKVELENSKNDLINEKEKLAEFKAQVEKEQKTQLLSKYSEHLNDELITALRDSMDSYSVEDFNKEVCTAAVEHSATIFSKKQEPELFYKGATPIDKYEGRTAMERLLNKHISGGNK